MSIEFKPSTEESLSRKEYLISGIKVYSHHRKEHADLVQTAGNNGGLKIMFLLHGRGQDAQYLTPLITNIHHEYGGKDPLIIFSFDFRNHGHRLVDKDRNGDWSNGNGFHAQDMLSIIDSGVSELKVIIDYLSAYFPQLETYKVTKIVSGVSMGGHCTIRYASLYPDSFDVAIPIVGCFDLTSLLLNRIHPFNATRLYEDNYDNIKDFIESTKYPGPLFNESSKGDQNVFINYPLHGVKTLALFGELDDVVPLKYSVPFLENHGFTVEKRDGLTLETNFQAIKYFSKHQVTNEMVSDISRWLAAI